MQRSLQETLARCGGMRLLGPNCLGVIVPSLNLNASFAGSMPAGGSIAFISQSGALCTSVLDWAAEQSIGFSGFVSVGNAIDVGFSDLIDYFGEDESTGSIVLYLESVTDARSFLTASRAFARSKPIIVYKAGRHPRAAAAAASHTGAMVSEDSVYDAAFARAGMVRVDHIGDVFDCVELIGRRRLPTGPGLGIVTNAGGPGVMALDALMEHRGVCAELSPGGIAALDAALPAFWSRGNPVDILGDATAKRFEKACSIVLAEGSVDALLVILTPQGMTQPGRVARALARLAEGTRKPILASWMGGESVREGSRILTEAGIATYDTPERAVSAFMTLVRYSSNLASLNQTPRDIRLDLGTGRDRAAALLDPGSTGVRRTLTEREAKELLDCYGIPSTRPVAARDEESAVAAAERMGYPVVLKLDSPDVTHKTEAGGVRLDLAGSVQVAAAFRETIESARRHAPGALIHGVTVQRMVRTSPGVEMILGIKRDPVFGSVLMVGAGGITAEISADRVLGFPPLNESLVMRMLDSLRIRPLLEGFRGRPRVDLDALVRVVLRLSYLASDLPEVVELDVNPLFCSPREVIALDARVVVDPSSGPTRSYAHLALRPYPTELVTRETLKDGTPVRLRPIRPEDEPMWLELLGRCSRESIYSRFRHFYDWSTHEAAVRYCFIDYEREIALVAERDVADGRELLGVGRLVSDPDLDSVEYAVLVGDPWQNIGLGSLLTERCEAIAASRGARRIVAQTTADNARMMRLFRDRGFEWSHGEEGVVEVWKDLPTGAPG